MKLKVFVLFFVIAAIQVIGADDDKVAEEATGDGTKTEENVEQITSEDAAKSGDNTDSAVNVEKITDSEATDEAETAKSEVASEKIATEESTTNIEEKIAEEKTPIEENLKTAEEVINKQSPDDLRNSGALVVEFNVSDKAVSAEVFDSKSGGTEPNLSNTLRNAPDIDDAKVRSGIGSIETKERVASVGSSEFQSGALSRSGIPDPYLAIGARKMIDPKDLILGSSLESARRFQESRLPMPIVARAVAYEPFNGMGNHGVGTQRRYPADLLSTYQNKNLQLPSQFLYSPGSYDAKLRGTASLLNSMGPDTYNSFKSIVPEARFRPNIRSHDNHQIFDLSRYDPNKNAYPYSPNEVDTYSLDGKSQLLHSAKRETDNRKQYAAIDPKYPNIGMNYNLYGDLSRYRRSLASHLLPYYRYRFNNYRHNNVNYNRNYNY